VIGPSTFTSGVDFNTAGTASGSSIALTKPSGVVDGDYLFVFFQNQTGGGTITPPAGWTSAGITITSRTAQLYYKFIPTASAEAATSYTFSTSVSARMAGMIFRLSGVNAANPFDVKAAAETAGGAGVVNIASLTATGGGELAMVFPFSNGAISGTSYAYANGFTDSGIDGVGNPGGTRTDVGMGFKQISTAGAVGTTTVTGFAGSPNGFMVILAGLAGGTVSLAGSGTLAVTGTPSILDTVALSGAGALTVASSGSIADTVALAGSGALSVSGKPSMGGTVALSGAGTLAVRATTPLDTWIANQPMFVAHRGGSADWDQSTMFAYDQAASWNKDLALEVSIWKSADGYWVVNHDNDPSITGTWANPGTGTITARNWVGDLQNIVSSGHSSPMIRLTDVLAKYGSTRIIVIDNKAAKDLSTTTVGLSFLATLNAYAGNSRYILKSYYSGTDMSTFARAYGFKTWGYYYQADVASIASTASRWDILGMEYGATTGWDAVVATGQPFWAHILPTAAARTMADAHTVKPNGYMVSGVEEIVPQTPALAALTGAGTLAVQGSPVYAGTVALSGIGALIVGTGPVTGGAVVLAGDGTLTVAGSPVITATVVLGGVGQIQVGGSPVLAAVVVLSGGGVLVLLSNLRDITVIVAGPYRNPLQVDGPTRNPLTVSGATT
jgi:hypothetical protein